MPADVPAPSAPARCSFCRKGPEAVKVLVAGPGVYICDLCVALAHDSLAPLAGLKATVPFDPRRHFRTFASDRLLAFVARIEPVHGDIVAQQTLLVSILRERAVSWTSIGAALGVTRQAAWRRFAGPAR